MHAFSLVDPANPIRVVDLLIEQVIPFSGLWDRSIEIPLHNTRVRVACLDDLIELKRRASRPQDLADIEQLEAIRRRAGV